MYNQYEELDQRISKRGRLAARIAACEENGKILVVESGMDCDCSQYDGRKRTIDATLQAYNQLNWNIADWADGPYSLSIERPSAGNAIEHTSRDLALEAFEDGHPHVIYA